VVFTQLPHGSGTYSLSFQGQAQVRSTESWNSVRNLAYDSASGTTTGQVVVGPNPDPTRYDGLTLVFTGTTNGVRSLCLIRPGYPADTRQIFTDVFLQRLAPFTTLRAMQFQSIVNSPLAHWEDRPKPGDARQSTERGVALEYCLMLAAFARKDVWLCVPDQADDEYVRNLPTQHTLARDYRLKSLSYEAGADLASPDGIAARAAAAHDPRMAEIVSRLVRAWYAGGNDMMVFYTLAQPDDQNGMAGLYSDIIQDTPKSLALRAVVATPLSTLLGQPLSAFLGVH
jgi:hypothetical protein